jgi:hypothetical protein
MAHLPLPLKETFYPIAVKRVEAMEAAGASDEQIIAVLTKIGAKHKVPVDDEATAWRQVQRIYVDLQWALKTKREITVSEHLAGAIRRCQSEVKNASVQQQAIEKFTQMNNRVSEFEFQDAEQVHCIVCGREISAFEPREPYRTGDNLNGIRCVDCKIKG